MTTYVTVAIPYVNAQPHVGYAYELVLADVYARTRRRAGGHGPGRGPGRSPVFAFLGYLRYRMRSYGGRVDGDLRGGGGPSARLERTLLAYSRTALAFVVAGLAVAGSRSFADTQRWFAALGLPLISSGVRSPPPSW